MCIRDRWTHPDFRVSAMSADGKVFGIIAPHQAPDVEGFLLELRGVVFRDSLAIGTEIRSSGQGSVFPRGIPIGIVVQDITSSSAYARTYLVRPAVMPADVTVLMVLLPTRSNLESAWKSRTADSITKAIGAAAESVKRSRPDTTKADSTRRPP